MIPECEKIADALRNEIQNYGELLNLFSQQQNAILARDPDWVLATSQMLESQVEVVDTCRREREALVSNLAGFFNKPPDLPLRELLADSPDVVRVLLFALIDEVNNLVFRTKRRARQNQMLLSRSVAISQEIIRRLNPGEVVKTYSSKGHPNLSVVDASGRPIAIS